MLPSTRSSNSTLRSYPTSRTSHGSSAAPNHPNHAKHKNGPQPLPTPPPPGFLTRPRAPLAERIQKRINTLQGKDENDSLSTPSPSGAQKRTRGERVAPPSSYRDSFRNSRVSPSPQKRFGGDRMDRAKGGHFKRPSLETNCLSARGEDNVLGFSQELPGPSHSNQTSFEEGPSFLNHRSFDHSKSFTLNNPSIPFSPLTPYADTAELESPLTRSAEAQIRARVRGHHMRAASRSFTQETIHEAHEGDHVVDSPSMGSVLAITALQLTTPEGAGVPQGRNENEKLVRRDREEKRKKLEKLRKLKYEAEVTVAESRKRWVDTAYSLSSVQNFQAPQDVESMHTLLRESTKNFRPLPSELRQHRRRTSRNLRTSPYAQARLSRASMSSLTSPRKGTICSPSPSLTQRAKKIGTAAVASPIPVPIQTLVLKDVSTHPNKCATPKMQTDGEIMKTLSPVNIQRKVAGREKSIATLGFLNQGTPKLKSRNSLPSASRVPQTPSVRRYSVNKENLIHEELKTPGGSLRIDRPRPRYRTPTPGPKRKPQKG